MKENLRDINNMLIKWLLLAVTFATPFIISPWNFDYFEFPKQVVIWVVALILLVLWLLRFVLDNEVKVIKTPIDLPLLLLIGFSAISLAFSSTRYSSLVGFFGRPDGGLASIVAYTVIFYVAASTLNRVKDVVHIAVSLLVSLGLLALLGLSYYFGIYILAWQPANIRTFSPVGGIYALALTLAMAVPVSLGLITFIRKTTPAPRPYQPEGAPGVASQTTQPVNTTQVSLSPFFKALLALFALVSLVFIATVVDTPSLVGVIAGIVALLLWSRRNDLKGATPYLVAIGVAMLFWVAIIRLPQVQQSIAGLKEPLQKAQSLSAAESWYIAGNTVRDFPFLGSGPATFLFDFTRYRSASYNLSDTWNLRFMVASNQYLQVLATVGILGFIAYLFLIGRVLWFGFKSSLGARDSALYPLKVGLFAGIVAFVFATLFTATTTVSMFTVFILLALLMATEKIAGGKDVTERHLSFVLTTPGQTTEAKPNNAVPLLFFIPGLVLAMAALFFISQYVRANAYYVAGVTTLASNQPNSAIKGLQLQEQSVQVNPWEDTFHRDLATTSFNLALAVSQKKDLTDNDKQTVTALLQQSIAQAQLASTLSPLNVNNWQVLADIYRRIAGQVQGAGDVALQSFNQAIQTDPANAQLFLDLGGIFYAANAYDPAIDAFKRAVALKPNLANAHYNLANAYVKKGEWDNAWAQYLATQQLINQLPASDTTKRQGLQTLQTEMDAIKDKISTQSAQPDQNGSPVNGTLASPTPLRSPLKNSTTATPPSR